jgi:hypothetical protein
MRTILPGGVGDGTAARESVDKGFRRAMSGMMRRLIEPFMVTVRCDG